MSILFMSILATEEFHDIAPPVDYSLIPPWLIFVGTFFALAITGLVVWLIAQKRKRPQPPQLPRDRALEALEQMRDQIDRLNPYQFSIRVSDILRRYVTEQHGLPVTRQTAMEFLIALSWPVVFPAVGQQSAAGAADILRTLLLASRAILVMAVERPQLVKSLIQSAARRIEIMLVVAGFGSMLTSDFTSGGHEAARVA